MNKTVFVFCFIVVICVAIEMVLENNENQLADEIAKVKDRLKTISSSLENQQTFLRLIIQVYANFTFSMKPIFLYVYLPIFSIIVARKWKSKPKKTRWTKACRQKSWR